MHMGPSQCELLFYGPIGSYILFLILYIILWQLIEKAEAREKERMKKEEREVKFFEGLYY